MNRRIQSRALALAVTLAVLAGACAAPGRAPTPGEGASTGSPATRAPAPPPAEAATSEAAPATPAERAWQNAFLLGITEGLDGELLEHLSALYARPDGEMPSPAELESLRGAGYRIARPEAILEAVTPLARYRQAASGDLEAERAELAEALPDTDTLDRELLAEEILLVRSAILDSLERRAAAGDWPDALNEPYRAGTLRSRNELEYAVFSRDMDALAARSIDDSAGRLDAFHRMLDDSADTAFLRERVLAAEEMNRQLTDEHREYATRRTVRALFFLLPAISSYFRYR